MRASVGATWVLSICLTLIIFFIAYLAISLNYSKAFIMKDYVVSKIEENEGYDSTLDKGIAEHLISQGYVSYGDCDDYIDVDGYNDQWSRVACINDDVPDALKGSKCSVCIYRNSDVHMVETDADSDTESNPGIRTRYRVLTFFKFDLPVVGYFTSIQVGGETRYINDFAHSYEDK